MANSTKLDGKSLTRDIFEISLIVTVFIIATIETLAAGWLLNKMIGNPSTLLGWESLRSGTVTLTPFFIYILAAIVFSKKTSRLEDWALARFGSRGVFVGCLLIAPALVPWMIMPVVCFFFPFWTIANIWIKVRPKKIDNPNRSALGYED